MTTHAPGYTVRRATEADLPAAQALMRETVEVDFGVADRPDDHRYIADLRGSYLTFPHSPGALAFWTSVATPVGEQPHTDIPREVFFEFDAATARRIVAGEWPARSA